MIYSWYLLLIYHDISVLYLYFIYFEIVDIYSRFTLGVYGWYWYISTVHQYIYSWFTLGGFLQLTIPKSWMVFSWKNHHQKRMMNRGYHHFSFWHSSPQSGIFGARNPWVLCDVCLRSPAGETTIGFTNQLSPCTIVFLALVKRFFPNGTSTRNDYFLFLSLHILFLGGPLSKSKYLFFFFNITMDQWEFQDPKMEVPTICKAYCSGLNFRGYPPKKWPKIWY